MAENFLSITCVRNEGPYLVEWIAHHLAAGITGFVVFSNDCDDGTVEILDLLQDDRILLHIPQKKLSNKSLQWQAYVNAWEMDICKSADWVLVSDVDEFLNIKCGEHTVNDLVSAVDPEVEAITLPWRLFGSNNLVGIRDEPITQQFTTSASEDLSFPIGASFFKTLFRKSGRFNKLGVHRPKQKNAERQGMPMWVSGSGKVLPKHFSQNDQRLSLLGTDMSGDFVELNHYSVKSVESFLVKTERGLPNRSDKELDLSYWVERNFNTIKNTTVGAMRQQTDAVISQLMAIPGLQGLHENSVLWHQKRAQMIKRTKAGFELFRRLTLAGSSREVDQEMAQEIYRNFSNIRD